MAIRDADWRDAGFTPETDRRFYTFDLDFSIRAQFKFEFVNEKEVMPPYSEQYGPHSAGVAGHRGIGLYPLLGVPHFVVPAKSKTELDFYYTTEFWIVSDRARRLFEAIDGPAFEFDEVHLTRGADGRMELGPYWRMDVIRVLDCIDDENSVTDGGPSGLNPKIFQYVRLVDIKFFSNIVGDAHAFRVRQGFGPIFDSAIVDEIRARKYRGMSFTPLQMMTFQEAKFANLGQNSEYWRPKSPIKEYWEARNAVSDRRYREKLAKEAK